MKQKTKFENSYIPIRDKNSIDEDPKCNKNIVISLLSILLLISVFIYLYISDSKNILEDVKTDFADFDTSHNYIADSYCSVTSDEHKFDCFPRGKADKESCEKRNCCWSPSTENSQVPWCYYSSNYSNYKIINVTTSRDEIIAFFNITANTIYKNDIKVLCMEISLRTAQRLRVKVIKKFSFNKF